MSFNYRDGVLFCEDVSLEEIAHKVGTPCYVYSYRAIVEGIRSYLDPLREVDGVACYAVKANSNLAVLRAIFREGAGADIVSGGELFRALRAGVDPGKVVYAGVGKTEEEMAYALRAGILMFNVESEEELEVLNRVAGSVGSKAPVALRVNPDVDPKTHPYISTGLRESKFGIDIDRAVEVYKKAASMEHLEVVGIHCHIGSQITSIDPFVDAVSRVLRVVDDLNSSGIKIRYLDVGGGIGIRYRDESPPAPSDLVERLKKEVKSRNLVLVMEPGRSVVGNAGIFLTRILYVKEKAGKVFYVVDGAMNDLARPALYNAYHEIWTVRESEGKVVADVVGPVCETGDFLAKERELPEVKRGNLLAVMSAGAYGFTMSSNYNSRPRVPEVMVRDGDFYVVRERESYEDLVRGERIPTFLLEG